MIAVAAVDAQQVATLWVAGLLLITVPSTTKAVSQIAEHASTQTDSAGSKLTAETGGS